MITRLKRLTAAVVARLRVPVTVLPVVAVLAGFGCAVAGLYLLAGLAVALLVAGVVVLVAGLVVDVG